MTTAQKKEKTDNVTHLQALSSNPSDAGIGVKVKPKDSPRVKKFCSGLPEKIMSVIGNLQFRPTPLESINSKTLCHELIVKAGLSVKDFPLDELKYAEERTSSYASSFFKKGKLRRTTKRINDGMFGYYINQSIQAGDTMDDRMKKADAVEQEQYKKLTSLKTIKELLPNLKPHELTQVMQVAGELLDAQCCRLIAENDEMLEKLVVAEDKNKSYEDKIRPLLAELES